MIKLNFKDLFTVCENLPYTVIKLSPNFPSYDQGGDIDIFCRDIEGFSKKVLAFLGNYVDQNYTIRVQKKLNKTQIDLLNGKEIHFRFDLIGAQPEYKNILVKPSFFDIVIENAEQRTVEDFSIKVPKLEDEVILRYLEYNEYFADRPNKIKHTDYINQMIEQGKINVKAFQEKLYYFTAIPEKNYCTKTWIEKIGERYKLILTLVAKAKHLFKEKGLVALFKKVIKRFR